MGVAAISQLWISSSYSKYSKVKPKNGLTGEQAGEKILQGEKFPVDIVVQGGSLSDHFDPRNNTVTLSTSSKNSSVADIAVTAHEFGHVSQKFSKSFLFNIRNSLVPVVNIGSQLGYILIILGFSLNLLQLSTIGLILFSFSTIFALITIPLERDATKRGLHFLSKYNLISQENLPGAKSILNAASMTYVASLITSLLNLFFFFSRVRRKH